MKRDQLKTIVKEFLSSDKGSLTMGDKYKSTFLNKRQEYIDNMLRNKNKFVKRYGKDAEKVLSGKAVKNAKNYIEKMKQQDLKELIRKSLMEEPEEINSKEFIDNRENPEDVIKMDIPLFIRMLEYAREDASNDIDLHDVAEKAISLSSDDKILNMDDYENIINIDNKKLSEEKSKKAGKSYGSEEAGKRVAGAVLKKILSKKGK